MRNLNEGRGLFRYLEARSIKEIIDGVQLTGNHFFDPTLTFRASNQFLGDGKIVIKRTDGILVIVFDVSLGRSQGTPIMDSQKQPINEGRILSDLILAANKIVDEEPDSSPPTFIATLCENFHPLYLSERTAPLDWGYSVSTALVPPQGNIELATVGTNFVAFGNVSHDPMFPVLLQPHTLFFTPSSRLDHRENPPIRESDVLPRNSVVLATDGIAREINLLRFGLANRGVNLRKMSLTTESQEGLYVVVTKAY